MLLLYNFYSLHCPLSGPDLIYISLLIIPCIIYYVTNKETLTLKCDCFFHTNIKIKISFQCCFFVDLECVYHCTKSHAIWTKIYKFSKCFCGSKRPRRMHKGFKMTVWNLRRRCWRRCGRNNSTHNSVLDSKKYKIYNRLEIYNRINVSRCGNRSVSGIIDFGTLNYKKIMHTPMQMIFLIIQWPVVNYYLLKDCESPKILNLGGAWI